MTQTYEHIDAVKLHWKHLLDMDARGQIVEVFGFGDADDDADALLENQLYKPIVGYMELTGKSFEEANADLVNYYAVGDAWTEANTIRYTGEK